MQGTKIIVSSHPKGVFEECKIVGTPKPGTVMELDDGVAPVGNVFSWAAYGSDAASGGNNVTADGDRKIIAILLEDWGQGKIYSDAYAAGDRGYLYFPVMGETFNMLLQDVAGTADDFTIGQELMVDDGTGKLLACDTDAEAHPFMCLETVTDPQADHWTWCMFTGSAG